MRQRTPFSFRSTRHLATSSLVAVACATAILLSSSAAYAQTVAYWRFEEGGVGTQPSTVSTPVLDSSGNGYNMGVLTAGSAPTYSSSVPSATIGQSGAANNRSLDFDGVDDEVYATGYTPGLNDYDFSAGWTVEAAFRFDTITARAPGPNPALPNDASPTVVQGVLAKEGKPVATENEPPLAFRLRNDGDEDDDNLTLNDFPHLEITGLNGSGDDDWNVDSRKTPTASPIVAGQWYYSAVVYNGTTVDLYLDSGNGYRWQNNTAIQKDGLSTPAWVNSVADWVIGREERNDNPINWMDGQVDEVRISSAALTPGEFLNNDPADFGPSSNLVTYTIDPSQSSYTWVGDVLGAPMLAQQPGSLTAALEGNITARLDGNTLSFGDDLSDIDMQAWGGPGFDPQLGSTKVTGNATVTYPATGEDNIGIDVPAIFGKIALRDAKFGISDGSADFGGPVTGLEVRTKSQRLDWYSDFFLINDAGSDIGGGGAGENTDPGNMTRDRDLVTGIETITIPIFFDISSDDFASAVGGEVVATRPWTGDFNLDGIVDGADFLVYQQGIGTLYDAVDLSIWKQNYGMIVPIPLGAGLAAVPEPGTCVLALMIGLVSLRSTRRRSR